MKKPQRTITLNLDESLRESPRQSTSMSLPLAIHRRLDRLAELADATNATRGEIIGMLIANSPEDPDELELAILRYRKSLVRDVVTLDADESQRDRNVIELPLRAPGRPSRHAGG